MERSVEKNETLRTDNIHLVLGLVLKSSKKHLEEILKALEYDPQIFIVYRKVASDKLYIVRKREGVKNYGHE